MDTQLLGCSLAYLRELLDGSHDRITVVSFRVAITGLPQIHSSGVITPPAKKKQRRRASKTDLEVDGSLLDLLAGMAPDESCESSESDGESIGLNAGIDEVSAAATVNATLLESLRIEVSTAIESVQCRSYSPEQKNVFS